MSGKGLAVKYSAPTFSGGDFSPPATNTYDLGDDDHYWNNLKVQTIVVGTAVMGNWEPSADDTYWVGGAAKGWKGFHMPDTLVTDDAGYVLLRNNANTDYVGLKVGSVQIQTVATGIDFVGTYTGNAIDFSNATIAPAGSNGPCFIRLGTYASPYDYGADEDQSGVIRIYTTTEAGGTSYDRGVFVCTKTTNTKGVFPISGLAEVNDIASGNGPTKVQAGQFIAHLNSATAKLAALGGDSTAGMYGLWAKITANSGATTASGSRAAPIWLDNQLYGANINAGMEEYAIFSTTGGSVPHAWAGFETTSSGWAQLLYFDETAYDQEPVSGTSLKVLVNATQYYLPFSLTNTGFGAGDNVSISVGADQDGVVYLRSAALNADTALTGVLIGTPDTPALAANSLIISNITADGDILIATNDGGTSKSGIHIDGSENTVDLGKPFSVRILDGQLRFGTGTAWACSLKYGEANTVYVWNDADNYYGRIVGYFKVIDLDFISDAQRIAAPGSDDEYTMIKAQDNGVGLVEVARFAGAADPYFSMGGSQEFKFYNSGDALVTLDKKLMFGDTAVYIFSDDDGYLDLTADAGIRANANLVIGTGKTLTGHNWAVENHTADDILTLAESSSIHTNYGEDGTVTLTLPASATAGTNFKFVVGFAGGLRIKVSAASEVFIVGGATSTDDGGGDMYLEADDEGEMADFICIASGVWLVYTVGTWAITQP
jgi:hypothetical protein